MALTTARRQRYHIDLQTLHADCEANYLRLMKLLPDLAIHDRRQLALQAANGTERHFQFAVTERSRYTATIEIAEFGQQLPWGLSATFIVRTYHDARMAEVLSFQRQRPNLPPGLLPRQYHPDEKSQWNRLLGEWLAHCLAQGYALAPAFASGSSRGTCP